VCSAVVSAWRAARGERCQSVADTPKYATYRKSDAPKDRGTPSSPTTTRTPTIILPTVWPNSAWSTVVYAAANTTVNVHTIGASVQASSTCVDQTRCASAPYDTCTRAKIPKSSAAASARNQKPAA